MKQYDEVYKEAVQLFGNDAQLRQTAEECCELGTAVLHYLRGKGSREDVLDEMADMTIMLGQLRAMLSVSSEELKEKQCEKVLMLLDKIGEHSERNNSLPLGIQ